MLDVGCSLKFVKRQRPTQLLAELRESFSMALNALTAHKLRSALTLLGVLIGVFSIIVVMTAMRVLERNIETNLSQLGGQTFAIQKWPEVQFGNRSDWEKYWRRKNITIEQGQTVAEKATLAAAVGVEGHFWGGGIQTRYTKTAPTVQLLGETPGSFLAHNWIPEEGRILDDSDVDNARDVCVLGSALAKTVFPFGSAVGEELKINGIHYAVVGVLASKGASLGGNQDNFAVVPLTTALDRYGLRWTGLSILVQARSAASYADCEEQVRGILRAARKVRPGAPGRFRVVLQRFVDRAIQHVHPRRAHRRDGGQFHRAARGRRRHHEHHARFGDGTDARNRRPPGRRRQAAEHHGAIHHGSGRAVRSRRRHRRGLRHSRRQRPRLVHESAARHPGGLDCAGPGDLLRRRNRLRHLSGVQGGEPRPD